jgi:maltooligosyltrehalose trehalohydrolase
VPDPLLPSTFESAKLDWRSREAPAGAKRLALMRELLSVRRDEIIPRLRGARFGEAVAAENGLLTARWQMGDGARLQLTANLSSQQIANASPLSTGSPIWGGDAGDRLPPWSVFWRIGG